MESIVIVDEKLKRVAERHDITKKIAHEFKLYLYHLECK